MVVTLIVFMAACAGFVFLAYKMRGKNQTSWLQFYAEGKDSGFTFKEIEQLHALAIKAKLDDPAMLFISMEQLDVCIRTFVTDIHSSGDSNNQESQILLSKLYDYRRKIEADKAGSKSGIFNSRQISEGQNLRVQITGSGVFRSQIVRNINTNLTISKPVSDRLSESFPWQGLKLSIYFWREEDAGYVFDTEVLGEIFSKGIPALKISHSDSLFRTQKRKSLRVKVSKAAYLYPLDNDEDPNKLEANPGLRCLLEDLSDSGCALAIGGKAESGFRIKVQFVLNNVPVCMGGTVRSVVYKEDTNRSILRVEADPLPVEARNQILGEVFGMLPEGEDDLPFRLLAEEANELSSESAKPESNISDDLLISAENID
ncbi:MAG: PilZ domain-containing protein [Treponema sp.]|nr:PilZ domain-containing protein [Treponema sp.]